MAVSAVARNTRGSLLFYEQTDIQTVATAGAQAMKAHLISSDIAFDQPLQESKVINATRNPTMPYQGGQEVKGNFVVQVDPIGIGYYLKWLLGAPTTTGAGPTYTHVFKLTANTLLGLTVERFLADITQAFRASGIKLNKFSTSLARGGCMEATFDAMGLDETRQTAVLDAAAFEPVKTKFLGGNVVMQEAGVNFGLVKKFDWSHDNQLQGLDVLGNNNQFYDFIEGIGAPAGTFEIYIKDGAIYDKGKAITKSSIKATFTASDNASTMEWLWPETFFMAFSPKISGGTGAISQGVVFKPFLDADPLSIGTAMQVTLSNLQPSYTTIPT